MALRRKSGINVFTGELAEGPDGQRRFQQRRTVSVNDPTTVRGDEPRTITRDARADEIDRANARAHENGPTQAPKRANAADAIDASVARTSNKGRRKGRTLLTGGLGAPAGASSAGKTLLGG